MAQNSAEVRDEIEQTRVELSVTVDAIEDKVNPKKAIGRRVDAFSSRVRDLKDSVVGGASGTSSAASEGLASKRDSVLSGASGAASGVASGAASAKDSVLSGASSAASGVTGAASGVKGAAAGLGGRVRQAPGAAQSGAEKNPLLAGIVALGAGAALGYALPASQREKVLAPKAVEKLQPVKEAATSHLKDAAMQVKEELAAPAHDAVQTVKERAAGAADEVRSEAQSAAQTVKDESSSAVQQVKDESSSAVQQVKDESSSAAQAVREESSSAVQQVKGEAQGSGGSSTPGSSLDDALGEPLSAGETPPAYTAPPAPGSYGSQP